MTPRKALAKKSRRSAFVTVSIRSLILGLLILINLSGCRKPDLSQATVAQLKLGMTLSEVEKLIGTKAKKSRPSVERKVNELAARFGRPPVAQKKDGATKYLFRKGNAYLFVDVNDESGKVIGFSRWASSSGRNMPKKYAP